MYVCMYVCMYMLYTSTVVYDLLIQASRGCCVAYGFKSFIATVVPCGTILPGSRASLVDHCLKKCCHETDLFTSYTTIDVMILHTQVVITMFTPSQLRLV